MAKNSLSNNQRENASYVRSILQKKSSLEKFSYLKADFQQIPKKNNEITNYFTAKKTFQPKGGFFTTERKKTDEEKFEEEILKALEESKRTFEFETMRKDEMDIEKEPKFYGDREELYRDYKLMIYGKIPEFQIEEHSMFPLGEEDLSPTYIRLEKR